MTPGFGFGPFFFFQDAQRRAQQAAPTDCRGLATLELPRSFRTIGELAFLNCTALTGTAAPSDEETADDDVHSAGSAGSAEAAVLHQLWREIRALLEAEAEAARAQAEKEVSEAQAAAEVVRAVRVEANGRFLEVLLSVSASASLC